MTGRAVPRRRRAGADPRAPRVLNPGGPLTDADRDDARQLLSSLTGAGIAGQGGAAFDPVALADHYAPGYDPARIVRVLTALAALLPAEIDRWKTSHLSRAMARDLWIELLFSSACLVCARDCHTCHLLADALGHQRSDDPNGTRTWSRKPEDEAS